MNLLSYVRLDSSRVHGQMYIVKSVYVAESGREDESHGEPLSCSGTGSFFFVELALSFSVVEFTSYWADTASVAVLRRTDAARETG
jgi:hypothetical protein